MSASTTTVESWDVLARAAAGKHALEESRLLREAMFQPTQRAAALYVPPAPKVLLRGARAWERGGRLLAPGVSGVLMVEADKQIYAVTAADGRVRRRRPIPIALASRDGARSARGGGAGE